jgi:hypothetical protein
VIKRAFLRVASAGAVVVLMAGCASGVKYQDMASSIPTIKQGEGRIYFYRDASMFGAAIQPDIRLNGAVVGQSKPGGFFFVDRAAGKYAASTSTEVENAANFVLDTGETKYLKTSPSLGVLMGRIVVEIETPEKAKADINSLSFTGGVTAAK